MNVALVVIAKDEDNYIEEFLNYHLCLGFSKIFVYQNFWEHKCPNYKGRVKWLKIDVSKPQPVAYNHFLENFCDGFDWVGVLDVDEFLVLKEYNDISSFLKRYNDSDALFFRWRLFGDNGLDCVSDGNYSVIKRFTKSDDHLSMHGKTFLNLRRFEKGTVRYFDAHVATSTEQKYLTTPSKIQKLSMTSYGLPKFYDSNGECAEIAHFRNKTKQERHDRCFGKPDVYLGSEAEMNGINSDGALQHTSKEVEDRLFNDHNKNIIENFDVVNQYERIRPSIHVMIPTKNVGGLIDLCVNSIENNTCNHINYDINIALTTDDDNDCKCVGKLCERFGNVNLSTGHKYHYATLNNSMVNEIFGKIPDNDYLVFCNDDVEFKSDCLDLMFRPFAELGDLVGTTGSILYYPDGTIQHCGIFVDFSRVGVGHIGQHKKFEELGIKNTGIFQVFGNTAALLMIKAGTFRKFGMFNTDYKKCFEDAELNLKLVDGGLKNFINLNSVAIHRESQSRGDDLDGVDIARIRRKITDTYLILKEREEKEKCGPYQS